MIYIITQSERGIRKWFYRDEILGKWNELMVFFKDKHIVEAFKSDTLEIADFLKIRFTQLKYGDSR